MVSTKLVAKTIPEIDNALKSFSGDMVKIEYIENCLKQLGLPNDVARFCHVQLAGLYEYKLMWNLAAKQMDNAAEKATSYKDKINFYNKEMDLLVKGADYLMLDKAFRKAMLCGASSQEKDLIKNSLKLSMMTRAAEFEKKNQRSNAGKIYERLLEMTYLINEDERKQLIAKLGEAYSKTGRIKEAMKYEQMLKKPLPPLSKDPDTNVKKVSWEDLGIDNY